MTTTATATKPSCLAAGLPDVGIYVACLASYNNGCLHGAWLDLTHVSHVEDIQEGIDWVLATSPTPGAEEYAIHDTCNLPSCVAGEWPDLYELVNYARALSQLQCVDPVSYRLACDHVGQVLTADQFEDLNHGLWDTPEAFAQDWYEQTTNLSELGGLACYINWERVWHGEFACDGYSAHFIPDLGDYLILGQL